MLLLKTFIISLVLFSSTLFAFSESAGREAPYQCPSGQAQVQGGVSRDLVDICSGVTSALTFFALHGVHLSEPISIEVAQRIPEEAGLSASGCFLEARRRVIVVPYEVFKRNATWFNIGIDREMYKALTVHEVSHAIAARIFLIPNPTIQAKEYLAYAAMFSTMPEQMREKAIEHLKPTGFKDFRRFSLALCMFDPMRFGAEAYLHFRSLEEPAVTIQSILAGKELID